MNENFITRFEVSNFKKFDHLVVENIGQVNLITGDNNVGKTCLLEALTLGDSSKKNISTLHHLLACRGFLYDDTLRLNSSDELDNYKNNIISFFQKDISKSIKTKTKFLQSEIKELSIKNEIVNVLDSKDSEIIHFVENLKKYPNINFLSKNWLLFYIDGKLNYMIDITSNYYNQFFNSETYFPFISLRDFFYDDMVEFYISATENVESKNRLFTVLNSIFPSYKIIDARPSTFHDRSYLEIATENNSNYHSITLYGDGFIRILRIILEMLINKTDKLMIDEIDTGVHYLKMKAEWKTIFALAQQTNTQIFATTHSKDCIEAYVEAAEEMSEWKSKIRLIELKETTLNDEQKIYANTYNYDQINTAINSDLNLRGGKVYA